MPSLPTLQKVKWLDNTSDSGLQLAGGHIEREGILLGMQLVPAAQGLSLVAFIRRLHDNNIAVLDAGSFTFVD